MLKRFFLNMLSSFVGAWIALALFVISAVLLVLGLMGSFALKSASQAEQVKSRSILVVDLDGVIEEREMAVEPDLSTILSGKLEAPQTLDVIVQSIREAATNARAGRATPSARNSSTSRRPRGEPRRSSHTATATPRDAIS